MSKPNFGAILDKPSTEVERPKPLPVGDYTVSVQGLPRYDKSSKKQTEFVEFTYRLLEAHDNVDPEALEALGGIADKTIKDTYYITENSLWRLKEMLLACGIEEGDNVSLRSMIEQTPGCQLVVTIKHTSSDDGRSTFANVGNVAALEG